MYPKKQEIHLPSHCDQLSPKSKEILKGVIEKVMSEARAQLISYVSIRYPSGETRFAFLSPSIQDILVSTAQEFMEGNIFSEMIKDIERFDKNGKRVSVKNFSKEDLRSINIDLKTLRPKLLYNIVDENGEQHMIEDIPNSGVRLEDEAICLTGELNSLTLPLTLFAQIFDQKVTALDQERFDEITGLLNRKNFEKETREKVDVQKNSGVYIFFDLDKFKGVNDIHGHAAGDHILKVWADLLKKHIRESDTVGRIGGDEFAIFLPGASETRGQDVSNKILEEWNSMVISYNDVENLDHGVSIGIATTDDVEYENKRVNEVKAKADAAMYAAKRRGRGCVVTYSEMTDDELVGAKDDAKKNNQ